MASNESKIVVAKRELKEEECQPTRNEALIARLKMDIAELKLYEEECKPTRNEAFIARLKVDIAKLELKEENLAETDKGTQIRLLLRPSPSCFLPPLPHASGLPLRRTVSKSSRASELLFLTIVQAACCAFFSAGQGEEAPLMGFAKMFTNPFVGNLCAALSLYRPEISKFLFGSHAAYSRLSHVGD
jgi:hypothetical protein